MSKYITKAELKGYDFNEPEHRYLFEIVNEKDENGYNGRYFSSWYFDMKRCDMDFANAMQDMIWCLIISYFKGHAYCFKNGHMSQLRLSDVAKYIGEKLNVWSGEIIRWMKGMSFCRKFDLDVCDHWGLDTITIFINK